MQITLFKEIVSSLVGSSAVKIVDLLYGKKNVNEFFIAKKLKLTINQTRNILYKLADEGLVSFVRKKDRKKGGWYTYFWTLNVGKSLYKFRDNLSTQIISMKNNINIKKSNQFFVCPNCHTEFSAEQALLGQYICPECGEVLGLKDNLQVVQDLEKQVAKLQKLLEEINGEIVIIDKSDEKIKQRKLKGIAKKKEKERQFRKKEKAKLLKKTQKKPSVNKNKDNKKGKTKKPRKNR